ncbi:MAG: radical protein [Gammaproteobacteria bacterium]|nr:radical protein [Gammaproteobacteria bacterium]
MLTEKLQSPIKGRGTPDKIDPRYLHYTRETVDDGWGYGDDEEKQRIPTTVTVEKPRTIISRNQSPDIPFEASINPYRGCEHGCIYCYARPTHAYMDLSPGIDFETKLFAKPNAADLLRVELGKPGYQCTPMALGTNTDPYQPIERDWQITRRIIEVLSECDHPLTIVTKSWLVERDIDLLALMAKKNLAQVFVSITTLDTALARKLEPRATAPHRRLETLAHLHEAGIPTGVMFAPVIPALNDTEMETVLTQSADAGVDSAGYVMLRLPHEVKILFREWLETHVPLKAKHIMNMVRDIRGGKDNDPHFKTRMRGQGVYAEIIKKRFQQVCKRLGLNKKRFILDTAKFLPPIKKGDQLSLF